MKKNPLLAPELREYIEQNDRDKLRDVCTEAHPADVAMFLSALEPQEAKIALDACAPELRAEIFSHLHDDLQVDLSEVLSREELVVLLTHMSPDDRVDLIQDMPAKKRQVVLGAMAQAEREDIRRLTSYEEGTAGAVMTSDYVTLSPGTTTGDAIEQLRREAPDKETIYSAYIVDGLRRLIGSVSLKDMILAKPETQIADIMQRDVLSVKGTEDQEEAARMIRKYDMLALPVVDNNGLLVGIITHDDAMDVLIQEQTEDIERLMAIGGPHEPGMYLRTSAWEHFRRRVGWIVILAGLGMVSGFIVQRFEGLLAQFAILAAFMPMLADTGGNTGSQSSTLVVRALALRDVTPRDIGKVLLKELQVALPLGVVLSVLAFGRVALFPHADGAGGHPWWQVGLAISAALGLQVVTSTLIGALLPIGAAKLKVDPAVVASPALTTVVDITGLLLYFVTVKTMLGL